MSFRKQVILAGVVLFGALGDTCLSRGMKQLGGVSPGRWTEAVTAVFTPCVALGILLLFGFFACYLTALSFADLTYVLPATSVGYVLMALLAKFFLHEQISPWRWMGIALIAVGVGVVTGGPAKTHQPPTREDA
ncbi:MAG: EamA family transporter [Terriglobales bacterium]